MLDECALANQLEKLVAGDVVVVLAVLFAWARRARRVYTKGGVQSQKAGET